jgi:apolipoprotein N-acyltransferase
VLDLVRRMNWPILLAVICSGLLTAAPFLLPALFPLAWVSLVPLFWALRQGTPWQGFFYGWLAGIVANLTGFYWLNYTISVFGGFSYALGALVFAGFGLCAGLPFAIFSALVRSCGFGIMTVLPSLFWVALEFWFPLLFPWHFANSQSQFLTLIQSADLTGPYGTGFLLIWSNTIIARSVIARRTERKSLMKAGAVMVAAVFAALLYGHWRLKSVAGEMSAARTLSVAAIQGSIEISKKWNVSFLASNLESYRQLSQDTQGATLVVWPESAVENWVSEKIAQLPPTVMPVLPPDTRYLIFGARSFRGDPARPDVKAFNSAFLVDSQGRAMAYYHKQVLLAFGEYIPLSEYVGKLPGMPPIGGGFTAGAEPRTLDLPEGIRIGTLICYEDLIPFLARAFVRESKANLLLNLTNDAWFGPTVAPWQHARLSQWRAIETRRTLVRATNTGLTTIINARGEMLQTLPLFTTGILKANAEILESETLYVRFGDWFAWSATLLFQLRRSLSDRFMAQ